MKKLLLSLAALLMLSGCTTYKNLTNDSRFAGIVGNNYQTEIDFAVFSFPDDRDKYILHRFGTQDVPALDKIEEFPFNYYGNIIYGVLSKGTKFKVIKVVFKDTFESSYTNYFAEILDGPFKGYKIDVSLLTGAGEVPQFLEKYAVEVPAKTESSQ